MCEINHQQFIEKIKSIELVSLLYNIVEAKAGRHIDIICEVPMDMIQEAETGLKALINYSKSLAAQNH
jgi:hypothetical protein